MATRFIALASVGNAAKEKFIYALNITAVEKMRLTDLIQKTTNEIPCPYDSMKFSVAGIKVAKQAEHNQYFYNLDAGNDQRYQKRSKFNQDGGHQQQKRPRLPNFDQGLYAILLSLLDIEMFTIILLNFRKMLVLSIIAIR